MREFVESLHRLYATDNITDNFLRTLFSNKKLTKEELEYILNSSNKTN